MDGTGIIDGNDYYYNCWKISKDEDFFYKLFARSLVEEEDGHSSLNKM